VTARLIAAAVLLLVVAWLAACAEAGLARTTSYRAEEAVRQGRRGAERLAVVAADPTRYLNLALLVRVACEVASGVLVTYTALRVFEDTWESLAVAMGVMVLVSYVAIGVSPRTIGRQHPLNTATAASYVLVPLVRILGPVPQLLIPSAMRSRPERASARVRSRVRRSCGRWSTWPSRSP
jgi:Mg2+/Co2+ transporter CorB